MQLLDAGIEISQRYGTPMREQPIIREQCEWQGGQMGGECECSVSPLVIKTYVCVLTFSCHFFSRSPTITEAFHNHLHGFLCFPILDRATCSTSILRRTVFLFG
jgi:hypothetical protein